MGLAGWPSADRRSRRKSSHRFLDLTSAGTIGRIARRQHDCHNFSDRRGRFHGERGIFPRRRRCRAAEGLLQSRFDDWDKRAYADGIELHGGKLPTQSPSPEHPEQSRETTTVNLAVHGPSFTLSTSQYGLTVNPGASATSTITVNPLYGFTGAVNLQVSGLPAGLTGSFGTNPTSTTSVLTLQASAGPRTGLDT